MMERIKLNYANCLTQYVGEQGLQLEDIKDVGKAAARAFKGVEAKKQAGEIGFRLLPFDTDLAKNIKSLAEQYRHKYENFVVIGIGGSALGNSALQQSLRHLYWNLLDTEQRKGWLRLFVLDNVDPEFIKGVLDVIDVKKTVFNIISKAGTTAECLAAYFILQQALIEKTGGKDFQNQIIMTTDAQKGYLRELVNKEKFTAFNIPDNVGGRFSVLSPVGLVSAAFTGIDIEQLLLGAQEMEKLCTQDDSFRNPALLYATIEFLFYQRNKRISVMLPYAQSLYGIADWYRQLWAESLGKRVNIRNEIVNVGPTPVKALGVTDQHSQLQLYMEGPFDKIITFLSVEKFADEVRIPNFDNNYLGGHTLNELFKAEENASRLALARNKRPNCTVIIPEITPYYVGQVLQFFELATAYAGELFEINAFDQPGVVLGKELTYALMGRPGYQEKKIEIETELQKTLKCPYII